MQNFMRNKIFFEKHIDKTPSELYNLHNGRDVLERKIYRK
ncbi:hypothetical protein HMPREF0372_00695 [Flavonifractor plautii ATCC 29863]|uniref:Uncharacterized protein n=1 Tax=Flavonifractor plautii ATCC 29863 TaxID=411475 RepID=G9YMH3_FLAPL|nr:hypothetical protein HMPREF0372_00695 [Flavonifractor plautii ATCC 29863]